MKKFLLLFVSLFMPFLVNAASVSMTGTTTISPGETVALPIIVSDSNEIHGVQMVMTLSGSDFDLLIDKTVSSYQILVKKKLSNGYGLSIISTSKKIANKGTLAKIYIKANSSATPGNKATLTLKDIIFATGAELNDTKASNYSKTLTVGAVKSTNNYLSSLKVEGYNISFNKNTTAYTINGATSGSALKVTANAEDEKANVKINSPKLVSGKNTITVVVTAESGAKRTYTITVNVPTETVDKSAIDLKTLEVKGYDIKFDPQNTDYVLNVNNDVEKVEINSTLKDETSSKTMNGPDKLQVGENLYTITVTDKSGNKKVYKLTINRLAKEKECEVCKVCDECESGSSIWKFLAIALVIVTLAETIYMVSMRDKKQF